MDSNKLSPAKNESQLVGWRQGGRGESRIVFCFATVVFTLIAVSLLFLPAQRAFPAPLPQTGEQGGGYHGGAHMRGHNELGYLSKALNLTNQQKAQIKPILQDQRKAMMSLRQDTSLSRQERMSKFMAIRKQTMDKIRPILTSEQQTKLQQMEQQREERMKQWQQRREGSGNPASTSQSQ